MICSLLELKVLLIPGRRVLGLDLGLKTIGLALSDTSLTIATPLMVIKRGAVAKDISALVGSIMTYNVNAVVVGLPTQMDGTEGKQAILTRAFVENLLDSININVVFWDERLSSVAVERILITEANLSRKRRKGVIDKVAAAYILQGALNALTYLVLCILLYL